MSILSDLPDHVQAALIKAARSKMEAQVAAADVASRQKMIQQAHLDLTTAEQLAAARAEQFQADVAMLRSVLASYLQPQARSTPAA